MNLPSEYRDCIEIDSVELGETGVMEMDIVTKSDSLPATAKPYRATREDREIINNIVSVWRQAGFVRDTTSPYASPILLVIKTGNLS